MWAGSTIGVLTALVVWLWARDLAEPSRIRAERDARFKAYYEGHFVFAALRWFALDALLRPTPWEDRMAKARADLEARRGAALGYR